jgi:hypothetical protein
MKQQKCKLCLQTKDIVESHLLSEFLYKHTYDSQHRFVSLN